MERIVIRNYFRVFDTVTHCYVALNTITDKKGYQRYTSRFLSYKEAQAAANLYALACGSKPERYKVETYASGKPAILQPLTKEQGRLLRLYKSLSGKGLALNSRIPKQEEQKYSPDKYYGREVFMYQSTERSKGISLIHKLGDKNKNTNPDIHTFERIQALTNKGVLLDCLTGGIVTHLLKRKWANRKEVKDYIRSRGGYSARQINRIVSQYYQSLTSK